MDNKVMCVWTDVVEVAQYRVQWRVFVDTFMAIKIAV